MSRTTSDQLARGMQVRVREEDWLVDVERNARAATSVDDIELDIEA